MTYREVVARLSYAFGFEIGDDEFYGSQDLGSEVPGSISAFDAVNRLFMAHISRFSRSEKGLADVVFWMSVHGDGRRPVEIPGMLREWLVSGM